MPSLNALGEFRNSFNDIANEKNDVKSRNLYFDDLTLPDTEAAPIEPPAPQEPPVQEEPIPSEDTFDPGGGVADLDFGSLLGALPADTSPSSIDDILNNISAPVSDPPGIDDIFNDYGTIPDEDILPDDDLPSIDDMSPDDGLLTEDDFLTGDGASSLDETSAPDQDDFSIPDGLLSNLPGELESAPPDFSTDDFGADDEIGADDLGALPDFDFPGTEPAADAGADDLGALPDFDFPGTEPAADAGADDLGALPDFDFPGTEPAADAGADDLGALPDFDFPGLEPAADAGADDLGALPDFDFPGLEPASDIDTDDLGTLPDLDLPAPETGIPDEDRRAYDLGGERQDGTLSSDSFSDESLLSDDELLSESLDSDLGIDLDSEPLGIPGEDSDDLDGLLSGDSFPDFPDADTSTQDSSGFDGLPDISFPDDDSGSMGSALDDAGELPGFGDDFGSDSIDLDTEPEMQANDDFGDDDFSLPVLDEIFDSAKIAPIEQPKQKKGLFGRRKDEAQKEEEATDVEEIKLEQEELDRLLETLAGYPLNLRVACEELLAEQVLEPQQLSKLIRLLVNGANVKEMAEFAGSLLKKTIIIPKSFQKSTGAEWEAEKSSFAYIFVHNFLPVLRIFSFIAVMAASIFYLGYRFIYLPQRAETIYKRGYERIFAGEYQRANDLFNEAFAIHRKKNWFYEYARGFRDQRRYMLAEAKYDELLRYYPRDKRGVLEYADLQTNFIMNYDKANRILQEQLLDYAPNDFDGLLAAGDNFFAWADSDPSRYFDKYEDARYSYARLLERFGWTPPVVERMMRYFIRTDNLMEVLNLRSWFEERLDRRLSPASTAELGGYLLDKQLEDVRGVPNPYIESIESVRAMLLQAVREDPYIPELHYHLARYYNSLGNVYEERLTLENAIRAFDLAENESVRRRLYNVDTRYRYANLLINNREFFPAEEQVVEGITLFEDYVSRNLITVSPQLGQLYALRGDLEYFVKTGNMQAALNNYRISERYGWSPPEIQYRMGAAYYQLEDWGNALEYLFSASADLPLNRRMLFALGNTAYRRGDHFAAQGYFSRLLDMLDNQRVRLPVTLPNDSPEFLELGERLMMARNNAGVVYEALAEQTGNRDYRSRALSLYAESARAWDSITRNPSTMARMNLSDSPSAPGINLGFLNAGNALRPVPNYNPEIFVRIDKDVLEPSRWEELAPFGGLIN